MIHVDRPAVVEIERYNLETKFKEAHIKELLKDNRIGMIAEVDKKVVGHIFYELYKDHFHILSLAVHPDHRRQGVGRAIIEKMKKKLSGTKRERISIDLRESNLSGQIFLREMGFKCNSIEKGYIREYGDSDVLTNTEDAYLFSYEKVT